MPSYEHIRLIGGPCNGQIHSWDGGDYFEVAERPPVALRDLKAFDVVRAEDVEIKRHTYRREIDTNGNRTSRFVYLGG